MMATEAKQRVVVIAIDASDNAKDAFDCTYMCTVLTLPAVAGYLRH